MNQTPPARCGVLYIDDEEKALKYFRMALASKFSILTASSGEEGLALLRKEPGKIGIVVSDQRMPGMIGAEVLGAVREEFPQVIRILTTAYSDLDSAILAVNKGHIYQYVVKPWDVTELEMVLQRAADYHQILTERNELLRLKMSTLQRIICCDRIKWMLLEYGCGSESSASAFRNALHSLIRSLAALPPPGRGRETIFRTEQFEPADLIRKELQTGMEIHALLADGLPDSSAFNGREQLSKLGERGPELAAALGGFLSSLTGEATADAKTAEGVEVMISSTSAGFYGELTGLLFGQNPKPCSVHLLNLLWKFAGARVALTIDVQEPGRGVQRIGSSLQPSSPAELMDTLRELFERWDIASI